MSVAKQFLVNMGQFRGQLFPTQIARDDKEISLDLENTIQTVGTYDFNYWSNWK